MSQVFNFIESHQNWNDNNKHSSDESCLFFNDNIQRYPSLFENPLSSSINNFNFNSQLNDQYFQTEQQCFYATELPLNKSFQYVEQSQYNQLQYQKISSKDYQKVDKADTDFFKSMSIQQEQSFIFSLKEQEEAISKEEYEQNICLETEKDDNLSMTHSSQSNHNQNSFNQSYQNSSQINTKTEETTTELVKQEKISSKAICKKKQQQRNSSNPSQKNFEKSKQSISKNNIRNFLTPIVRMRSNVIDYKILEKENVTTLAFDSFLKEHFYMPGKSKLKIRQAKFDSLLNTHDNTQMSEKRVFAQIVIKNIQNLFMNLIIEKNSTFNNLQFHQQFEWINGINESLVIFLNSAQSQN